MSTSTAAELKQKTCQPCEGGVPPVPSDEAARLLQDLPGWKLSGDARSIEREWTVKDFQAGLKFFGRVGELAEEEQHHPDLHLTGYRKVRVELSTHAIGGLSENDFILAAKINDLPVVLKKS